jgi:transposase
MAKGTRLTEEERKIIKILKEENLSNRSIATKIGRSEKVVRNFLKKGPKYGIKQPTKGNTKVTLRLKGQIRHEATKKRLSCSQIKAELGVPVTKRHIARILNESPNIKWKKLQGKPKLTATHKQNRLNFARKYMEWKLEWRNVVFSDEKKFNLDGPDCYSCYWHDLSQQNVVRSKRNFGGGSLMVWGAFSYNSKLPICFISTRMNSEKYLELLEDVLIGHIDINATEDIVFQQDNASIHVSKQSKAWFAERDIPLLEWPACSPDCNPIENLWGILAGMVYANGRQFDNISSLKAVIQECWAKIDMATLQKLSDSMPNRIFQVIRNGGGHTKY